MKVSKKEIEKIIQNGNKYHDYVRSKFEKNIRYNFSEDEEYDSMWNDYYKAANRLIAGDHWNLLFSIIEYARNNGLKEDRIFSALFSLNIYVADMEKKDIISLPWEEHIKTNGKYGDWVVYFRLEENGEIYNRFFNNKEDADKFLLNVKGERNE